MGKQIPPLQFGIAIGVFIVAGFLIPGQWGLLLAGIILLGSLAQNPAGFNNLAQWIQSLGQQVQHVG